MSVLIGAKKASDTIQHLVLMLEKDCYHGDRFMLSHDKWKCMKPQPA